MVLTFLPVGHRLGNKKRETIRREPFKTIAQAKEIQQAWLKAGLKCIVRDRLNGDKEI